VAKEVAVIEVRPSRGRTAHVDGPAKFDDFVASRGAALSKTAFLLTGDHHLAHDLVQTALARTASHWHRVADGSPEAYARRVMVNERVSWWRRRRYVVEVLSDPEKLTESGANAIADPAERVVRRETVMAALAQVARAAARRDRAAVLR
jgi:DNA-directed RNA polymerase specialized sigma24 family protein